MKKELSKKFLNRMELIDKLFDEEKILYVEHYLLGILLFGEECNRKGMLFKTELWKALNKSAPKSVKQCIIIMKKLIEVEKIKRDVKIKLGIIPPDPLKVKVYEWLKLRNGNYTLIRYYIWVFISVFLTDYSDAKDRHSLFLNFKAAFVLTFYKNKL